MSGDPACLPRHLCFPGQGELLSLNCFFLTSKALSKYLMSHRSFRSLISHQLNLFFYFFFHQPNLKAMVTVTPALSAGLTL